LFTSPVLLFLFLPLVLGAYSLLGRRARNGFLLVASLLFYAWGEGTFVLVLCGSIAANYVFGRALDAPRRRTGVLAVAVAANLALLGTARPARGPFPRRLRAGRPDDLSRVPAGEDTSPGLRVAPGPARGLARHALARAGPTCATTSGGPRRTNESISAPARTGTSAAPSSPISE